MVDEVVPLSDAEKAFAASLRESRSAAANPPPERPGDIRAGVRSGVSQLTDQAVGESAVGLGRVLGSERLEQFGERRVAQGQETMREAAEGRVLQPTDVSSAGEAADAFQFALGQQLPRIGAVAAAGAAGAKAGSRFGTPGRIAGGVLGAMGVNLPTMFGEARGEQREIGVDDPGAALRTAATAASVETLSDAALFGAGKLVRAAGFTPANRLQAVLAASAGNIPIQAATELAQEEVFLRAREDMDPEFDIGGDEANLRRINAAILGAVLGPAFAGGVAALQRSPARDEELTDEGVDLPPGQDIPAQPTPEGAAVVPEADIPAADAPPVQPGATAATAPEQTVDTIPDSDIPLDELGLTPQPEPPAQAVSPDQQDASQAAGIPSASPRTGGDAAPTTPAPQAAPIEPAPVITPEGEAVAPAADAAPTLDTATPIPVPDPDTPASQATDVPVTPLEGEPVTWTSAAGERRVIGTTPEGDVVVDTAGQDRVVVPMAEMRATIDRDIETARAVTPEKTPEQADVDNEVDRLTGDAPTPPSAIPTLPQDPPPRVPEAPVGGTPTAAPPVDTGLAPEPTLPQDPPPVEGTPATQGEGATAPVPAADRIVSGEPVDASDTFEPGAQRQTYTDPESGGRIEVVRRPDGTASVIGLEVPEGSRGQGIGSALQARAQRDNPLLMGQVSSKAAATNAYRLGRRPVGQPNATLDEVFSAIDRDSSVNMVTPEMQARLQPPEPATPADTFDELESLDGVDPYDTAEVRPGTTNEQRAKGRSALRDLFRQLTARYQRSRRTNSDDGEISLIGATMYKNFKAGQPNQLVGQRVGSASDLAAIAQVYRDPRFETFRYVFVDSNGVVLGETAISSRLPSAVIFSNAQYDRNQSWVEVLSEGMRKYEAAGYYMMHNHPSGSSQPSGADSIMTRAVSGVVPGFIKHVVIDRNEYSTITGQGVTSTFKNADINATDYRSNPEQPHGVLGKRLNTELSVARVVKALELGERAAVITTDAYGQVSLVAGMPFDAIMQAKGSKKRQSVVLAALRRMTRAGGADIRISLVLPPGKTLDGLNWAKRPFQMITDSEGKILHQRRGLRSVFENEPFVRGLISEDVVEETTPTPPSKLGTPAFKKFFEGSQVTDEEGQAKVVYHGTSNNQRGEAFTSFDTYGSQYGLFGQGSYFTEDPAVASSYTSKGRGDTPTVYPVYLAIKNPIDMDAAADVSAWQRAFPEVEFEQSAIDIGTNESMYRDLEEYVQSEGMVDYEGAEFIQGGLTEMGHDGVTHIGGGRATNSDVRHRVWITFEPEQVKSATGNAGSFDPNSPDIRFAQGTPTLGITADVVSTEVASISADWADAPPINVVQTTAELPEAISSYAQEAGVDPAGVFWRGEAYMVADNIRSQQEVRTVLAHEVLGHGGLRALFGNQFGTFAQRVASDLKGNKHFDKFVAAEGYRLSDPQEAATAADEYLAHIAQRIDEGTATERMRAVWSRVLTAVNELLRGIGFNVKFSNAEMHTLMMTARQRVTGGVAELSPTMVSIANGDVEVVPPAFMAKGDTAKDALNGFATPLGNLKNTGTALRGLASDVLPFVLKMTSRQDMVRNFGPMFQNGKNNLLETYVRADREQSAFTDGRMVGADKVFREQLRALPKDQRNAVHNVMGFATLRELKAGEPMNKQQWTAQQWEESGNLGRYGSLSGAVKELNAQWSSLSKEAKDAYVAAIRPGNPNSMASMFKDVIEALEANVLDTMEPGDSRDAALKNVRQMRKMLRGDYAPLSRFGDYVIVGYKKNEDGSLERVERRQFGSAAQAQLYKAQLERKGTYDNVKDFTMAKFLQQTDGVGNAGFIGDFERALNQKMLAGLDPAVDAETISVTKDYIENVMDITRQFYYEQQPEGSILKHQMNREGVKGYEEDFSRSYAEYMMKHARTLGTLRYGVRKGEILRDMRRYLNEMNDGDTQAPPNYDGVRAGIVYNSVVERENTLRTETTAPVVQALGKYTFFQMLTSVSQYAVQTSQVPMFWLPSIGARPGVGFGRASAEMGKAIQTIATGKVGSAQIQSKEMDELTERLFQQVTPENRDNYPGKRIWDNILNDQELDAEISKLPKDTQELLALRIMADRGVLDITRSHDLQRGATDNFGIAKTETGHMLNRVVDKMGFIMRHSELTNRRVAILGTLRINRQDGRGFMAALKDAEDTTLRTQFDYSRANKAPWLTNDWMKVFTQVQSFRFYSLGFMLTEFNRAFMSRNIPQAERVEARRVLGYMLTTTSMYAGAIGTPLGYGLVAAANAIIGDDDEPFDAAHEADLFFRELGPAGETFSRLVLQKGIPGALGVDISRRTELASVFKSSVFDAPEGVTGNRYTEWLAAQLLGPSWSNFTNLVRAGEAIGEGDMVEANIRVMPAAIRDFARLYDVATNGVRGSGNMMLLSPEQLTPSDYLIMAVGLQPTRLNEIREANRSILDRNTVLSQRRSKIVRQVQRALEDNDDQALNEAYEELYDFNEAQPVFAVGKSDVMSAVKARVKQDLGVHTKRYLQIQDQYGYRHTPVETAQ